jgi:hypothetical protein
MAVDGEARGAERAQVHVAVDVAQVEVGLVERLEAQASERDEGDEEALLGQDDPILDMAEVEGIALISR